MALDAVLVLVSETGQRMVSLNGFMKGPGRTAIHQGEILKLSFHSKRAPQDSGRSAKGMHWPFQSSM